MIRLSSRIHRLIILVALAAASPGSAHPADETPPWKDPDRALEARVRDLVDRMTLEEKIGQLMTPSPAIERLGLPAYDHAPKGVAGRQRGTDFLRPLALAATFDPSLAYRVASALSEEARARFHAASPDDPPPSLSVLGPNLNVLRDPRWGRGGETFGEDPFLASYLAMGFVRGLQGNELIVIGEDTGPLHLKAVATLRDYAVSSGPESDRLRLDATVSLKDLRETYLMPFETAVRMGGAAAVMCAPSRVNGQPGCTSEHMLYRFLRGEWAFGGHVVSACDAVNALWGADDHSDVRTAAEAAAAALRRGTDLECGGAYEALGAAVVEGLVSEKDLDRALGRVLASRFRLGLFDPPDQVSWSATPPEAAASPAHRDLALQAARESIVLLRNEGRLLPLAKTLGRVAVIGPGADDLRALGEKLPATEVVRARVAPGDASVESQRARDEALAVARRADVVVAVLGRTDDDDRGDLQLPPGQQQLLEDLVATGQPVVLVLVSSGPLAVTWAAENVPAIVQVWGLGPAEGAALAEVLLGDHNPAGRLPVTVYRSVDQLPPFGDYSMAGRTYRYFEGAPLYPFGHGLSYTRFSYSRVRLTKRSLGVNEAFSAAVRVKNVGDVAGDEVVQIYLEHLSAPNRTPLRQLWGARRIHLEPGQGEFVDFSLRPRYLATVTDDGRVELLPGRIRLSIGGGQPGFEALAPTTDVVATEIEISGDPVTLVP